jgi:hypothetical protein
LLLWGAGALLAGTSYEAFSYLIKCAGRAVCQWTSGWEIAYLVFSAASVDAMLAAVAYSSASGKLRRGLLRYAGINLAVYLAVVLAGSLYPVKFLISFEMLLLVCMPAILIFLVLNGWRYARYKGRLDLALSGAWGGLILVIAAYFLYYISGWTQQLWTRGLWFSENDVLHIGLLAWMAYLALCLARQVHDESGDALSKL